MSEDLPDADNRVTVDANGRIQLLYRPNNLKAHRHAGDGDEADPARLGFWVVMTHSHGSNNTTHQCGTIVLRQRSARVGARSVTAARTTSTNLFVVDASFFPSSAAVNPALTIAAQALRVADHIKRRPDAMKARSFSHAGITVSDFNKAVQFYWDVFGCPLVGVADTPPDRVRRFFGVDARRSRPARSAGFACPAAACWRSSSSSRSSRRRGALEWRRPHAHFIQRQKSSEVARLSAEQRRRDASASPSVAARPLVLLRERLRRQPDRADGSRLHVSRAEWLGPLGGWLFRRGMYKKYYESRK